ncbi:MAG: endolytic transglycosylase MltG [Ruminococcaceae bacterium]|nr:endolytic transglycosylase MltG [Oscillospiraceae bacterium]
MAENKNNGRADLFEILNEVHNENSADSSKNAPEDGTRFESESHVEELLKILSSRGAEDVSADAVEEAKENPSLSPNQERTETPAEETTAMSEEETTEEAEKIEIPAALFGHLSNENDETSEASTLSDTDNHISAESEISHHFTDETEPAPPLPTDDDDEDDEEEDTKVKKVGRFFRGMSFIPKAVIYIVLVLVASAYLSYYIITIGNDVFALVTDSREVTLVIEEGATNETVAKLLEEKGVIKYGWVYNLYMKYRGDGDSEDEYIAGEHTLNQSFNYAQIITSLTTKNIQREIKRITIPEGFTVEQIITLLVDNGIGERNDYIEAINNYPYKWDFVQQLTEMGYSEDRIYRLEGYLYPDTYEFSTTEDEVYVINKMLNAFNDKFWREFIEIDDSGFSHQAHVLKEYGMTFDDVITFASIVQSEGGTETDFYYISYVFHNRLSHPYSFPKLESDATIQYVLPERVDSTELNIHYDSPYNTYDHNGLPPGAISNPGSDALNAVLYPEAPKNSNDREIDAYYFVANNAGKTYYAHNKDGHEANKRQAKADNEAIKAGTYAG